MSCIRGGMAYLYTLCMLHNFITECLSGSYGVNCGGTCGSCRSVTYCDTVNGICPQGCKPGYKGELCQQGRL